MIRSNGWLVSYGLLGLAQNGLVPVLMPLAGPHGSSAGLTYAAFALLGLFAPVLGSWADRTGCHRDLLIGGILGGGIMLLLFAVVHGPWRIVLAAGAGLGTMAAATAGNVLAIQGVAEGEWDTRVALLLRYFSAGQVIGLVLAGLLATRHTEGGFVFAGIILLVASILAMPSAPGCPPRASNGPPVKPMVGGDAGVSGPHHRGHHVTWQELRDYLAVINRPLRWFLLIWLIAYPAMNGFATLFPVAMTRGFGMNPILPSIAYAVGVGASLLLYRPVGVAAARIGEWRMLLTGFALRLALLGALALLGVLQFGWIAWPVLAGFALIQFVWPLLAVASSALSVRLAPEARGESIGLFNAVTSLAAAVGSALAGVIYGAAGFAALAAVTFVVVGVGWLLIAYRPAPLRVQDH